MLPLSGFSIGITGQRRATEQADMLVKRGATVMVGTVMQSVLLDDLDATITATREIVTTPADVIVLSTGVGTRSWMGVAELASLDDELRRASRSALVLARGPKARSAAMAAGIDVAWQAPGETGAEIVEHLEQLGAIGKRVAVQRDGGVDLPRSLAAMIRQLGAEVIEVPVYRWKLPDDVQPAQRLLGAVATGRIDAVTFTSAIAVDNFFELAPDDAALVAAFDGSCLAVGVGPITADALRRHGVHRLVEPARARLGSMIHTLVAAFEGRARRLTYEGVTALWQGLALEVEGLAPVMLTAGEARVLHLLLERGPGVVPKLELAEPGADSHAAEMAVTRLRAKLGPLGPAIWTVPRRGYRSALDVTAA